jgi:hypothetical protein
MLSKAACVPSGRTSLSSGAAKQLRSLAHEVDGTVLNQFQNNRRMVIQPLDASVGGAALHMPKKTRMGHQQGIAQTKACAASIASLEPVHYRHVQE